MNYYDIWAILQPGTAFKFALCLYNLDPVREA